MKRVIKILMCSLLVCMCGACSSLSFHSGNENWNIGNAKVLDDVQSIDIDWAVGNISIVYGKTNDVIIEETASKEIEDKLKVHWIVKGKTLKIDFYENQKGKSFDGVEKDLVVTIPQKCVLDTLNINSASGDNTILVNTNNLNVNSAEGAVIIDTDEIKKFDISSVSEDIKVSVHSFDTADIEMVSSNIVFEFDQDATFVAKINTVSGNVTSDFELEENDHTYTCKKGDSKIEINGVSGDISFVKRMN